MQRRLLASSLALVVIALVVFTVPVGISLANLLRDNLRDVVLREARTIALLQGQDNSTAALQALGRELELRSGARVELVGRDGVPAPGPSPAGPAGADLAAALAGTERVQWQDTSRLGGPALVVTVPSRTPSGQIVGAVRVSYPTQDLNDQIRGVWLFRLSAGLATVALTAVLAVLSARSLTRPLLSLQQAATRFGRGDLNVRAEEIGPEETRRVARAINDGAQRLEKLIHAQRRLVADVSHQLRSPLTALRLTLDNAQDAIDDPSAREAVDGAIAEVVRMSRLTNGLLALARAQADSTAREPLLVDEIVATRVDAWQSAAAERGIHLALESSSGGHAMLGPGHLEQVLDNLVANALDAAPSGSTVTLSVRSVSGSGAAPDAEAVEVVVQDHGPGLSAEQRQRAFDRFWRGRPGGTGLGLAIVRQLVEENHGQVILDDAPGGGLAARVQFRRLNPVEILASS